MSDRFNDARTYKRVAKPDNTNAKRISAQIDRNYLAYAEVVKVKDINENFKRLVKEFKECFILPMTARPTGLVKTQWISYYNSHR